VIEGWLFVYRNTRDEAVAGCAGSDHDSARLIFSSGHAPELRRQAEVCCVKGFRESIKCRDYLVEVELE
jgi:hypothetical protein